MSNVTDRNVIDEMFLEEEKKAIVLLIYDTIEWTFENKKRHKEMINNKLNDYLHYINSGQINEKYDNSKFDKVVIEIVGEYSFSKDAIDFFNQIKEILIKNNKNGINKVNIEFKWSHFFSENKSFNDGFVAKYKIDIDKIYPRLKINKSDDLKQIKLENVPDNFCGYSYFDNKYCLILIQDCGDIFYVLSADDIDGNDMYTEENVNSLFNKAFENLCKNVQFRMQETIKKGIYGILSGGYFESECLCMNNFWNEISNIFDDDLLISVPAKDLVYFVPLSNIKLIDDFLTFSKNAYENVAKSNSELLFTKDIFEYIRKDNKLNISTKYNLNQ